MTAYYKEFKGKYMEYICPNCEFWCLVPYQLGFNETIIFDCPRCKEGDCECNQDNITLKKSLNTWDATLKIDEHEG